MYLIPPVCPECEEPVVDGINVINVMDVDREVIIVCKEHVDEYPGDFERVDS